MLCNYKKSHIEIPMFKYEFDNFERDAEIMLVRFLGSVKLWASFLVLYDFSFTEHVDFVRIYCLWPAATLKHQHSVIQLSFLLWALARIDDICTNVSWSQADIKVLYKSPGYTHIASGFCEPSHRVSVRPG